MTSVRTLGAIIVMSMVALASCGGDTENTSSTQAAVPTSDAVSATTQHPGNPVTGDVPMSATLDPAGSVDGGDVGRTYIDADFPAELTGIVGLAVTDLATRLSVEKATVKVVLVAEMVWGDASHGCPQPGMSYTQVPVDGLRMVLEADGLLYDYRSGGMSDPALCERTIDVDKSRGGLYELTEDGRVIPLQPPSDDGAEPTDGLNPPDK